ncbi:MAG: M28 family peptidase [Ignavibacteriaceae bacterium]
MSSLAQINKQEKYYRGTQINPVIEAMINSVSTDSILSYLETIVSFHTRHTNSDTTSPSIGIGAARNYILSKFQDYAAQSGGDLLPGFFVFPATVCSKFNAAHKNVMATVTGSLSPERIFIVSGHMDSRTVDVCDDTSFAPSANDDGSGTVLSMEMARVISQFTNNIENTLIMMTVTGEDQGLFGSEAYADWAFENGLRIDGMVTNDVVGNIVGCVDPGCPNGNFITDSTSVRHFSGGESTSSSRQLTRYMKLKAEQYVTEVPWAVNLIPAIDRPGRSGDHVPFFENGYAAGRFTEAHENGDGSGANGHQHNQFDLIEFMNIPYVARMVKTNIAGMACLAMAPETPSAPLIVRNVGNGTDVLLTWINTNTEPDFDGYRIAYRHPDSLFYEQIIPVGNVTQYTATGLIPEQPIYFCYSALDTDGNESIFSPEVLVIPSTIPAIPQEFDATSKTNGIKLDWLPNTELDLDGYTITRTADQQPNAEFTVGAAEVTFFDNTADPHIYYLYSIQARDVNNNLSDPSAVKRGRLATHDSGILIMDASRDGNGINPIFPTDEAVDDFYTSILGHFNVTDEWDVADSLLQNKLISDADMGIYSTIVLHSDTRFPEHKIAEDTTALRKYLQNGGQLLLSGWKLIENVSEDNAAVKSFQPGNFIYNYMQIDSSEVASSNDFKGANTLASGYFSIMVDSVKIPTFGGDLIAMEVFHSVTGGSNTQLLHSYRSSQQPPSPFHDLPVSLQHLSISTRIIVFDFPLYYMNQVEAEQNITAGLITLGEIVGVEDESNDVASIPEEFILHQNYPNPFNPVTIIKFSIPIKSNISLMLYNVIGEQLRVFLDEEKPPGNYEVEFNASELSSGVYFYRLQVYAPGRAGSFVETKKMVLLR